MTATEQNIRDQLGAMGFSLSSHTVDAGGLNRDSVFSVTLTRNGQSFTTEYRKGCGHRVWESRRDAGDYWWRHFKPGKRVELLNVKLLNPKDCEPGQRERQLAVFAEFERLTAPIAPTLEEVVYALHSDANCVRHGQSFAEFCGEFGYDADSRKAEACFNACRDEWSGLVRLDADFAALDELFVSY